MSSRVTPLGRSRDIVEAALGAGTSWIDTSETYFDSRNERTIAAALRDVGEEVLLSTKVPVL